MVGKAWISGAWANQPDVIDYRCEWIGEKLIERVTFTAQPQTASDTGSDREPLRCMGARHLLRFWLLTDDQVVDKAFDEEAQALGYFAPITKGIERRGDTLWASLLHLGILIYQDRRVTVSGEEEFERAIAQGTLVQEEIRIAEKRIRELTAAAAANRWPMPFVRNFAIMKEGVR